MSNIKKQIENRIAELRDQITGDVAWHVAKHGVEHLAGVFTKHGKYMYEDRNSIAENVVAVERLERILRAGDFPNEQTLPLQIHVILRKHFNWFRYPLTVANEIAQKVVEMLSKPNERRRITLQEPIIYEYRWADCDVKEMRVWMQPVEDNPYKFKIRFGDVRKGEATRDLIIVDYRDYQE